MSDGALLKFFLLLFPFVQETERRNLTCWKRWKETGIVCGKGAPPLKNLFPTVCILLLGMLGVIKRDKLLSFVISLRILVETDVIFRKLS